MFKERTIQQQTDILAGYLRNDDLHEAKNKQGSNLRKLLEGLSINFIDYRNFLNDIEKEYDPKLTTQLIEEWEGFVGIPDNFIGNTGSLEQRRLNVILKLSGINCTTQKQFKFVASILGYDVEVISGVDSSVSIPTADRPFTIVVNLSSVYAENIFPFYFPVSFSSGTPIILSGLFEKLKPANTNVIFNFI